MPRTPETPPVVSDMGQLQQVLLFCEELLTFHQISLMHKQPEQALLYFEQLYETRRLHLDHLENRWIPYYESSFPKLPKGGKPIYFRRERKLILKHTEKYVRLFSRYVQNPRAIKLDLPRLFEEYMFLKDLLDHHDARETKILLPFLGKNAAEHVLAGFMEEYNREIKLLWRRWEGIDV